MKAARTNRANLLNSSVVAVVVAVGVAVAVGVLCQQPGAQAQDATVAPSYTVKDLGTLGGPSSAAYGINDAGQVVGGRLPVAVYLMRSSTTGTLARRCRTLAPWAATIALAWA
jgi:uncharacterized membrane protein